MTPDMAFAVFMDACAAQYARDAMYRRKLSRELPAAKTTERKKRTA